MKIQKINYAALYHTGYKEAVDWRKFLEEKDSFGVEIGASQIPTLGPSPCSPVPVKNLCFYLTVPKHNLHQSHHTK